jgi:hypothetical protein
MIVRNVLNDEKVVERFDYFNDYDNTANWLLGIVADAVQQGDIEKAAHASKVKTKLDAGYDAWLVEWRKRLQRQ